MKNLILFLALDKLIDAEDETLKIAKVLVSEYPDKLGCKINLDYVLFRGIEEAVSRVREFVECPLFLDLKMWNGQRTMLKILEKAVILEVDFINAYILAENQLRQVIQGVINTKTNVLGITILSHYNDDYCWEYFGRSLFSTVHHFVKIAEDIGCDGVILPGQTLGLVHNSKLIKVVPGIRPQWYQDTRHELAITPKEAFDKGADVLVCGNPIMKSSDPQEALKMILEEIIPPPPPPI